MTYKIIRPSPSPDFEPLREEDLSAIELNDFVKLKFAVEGNDSEPVERMWVIVEDRSNPEEWIGVLDNDPHGENLKQEITAGDEVKFHPLDIIQIMKQPTE